MQKLRKALPHAVPSWVADDSRYFITINARQRGIDTLCCEKRGEALLASIPVYERADKWFVLAMVVMPDHVHLIASFNRMPGIRAVITSWKSYFAKQLGIEWQYNFFEHRLRNEDAFTEKLHYVLMNPVRKGLAEAWDQWPHTFVRGSWAKPSASGPAGTPDPT